MSQLQGHENWAYFNVMEAKNGLFSVFLSPEKLIKSEFFSRAHQKKNYDILAQLTKISFKIWKTFTK